MGLITKEIEVTLSNNARYYEDLGYLIPRKKDKWGSITIPRGTKILVKVEDLPNNSNVKGIKIKCDNPECNNLYLSPTTWQNYRKNVNKDGTYYCNSCISKLFNGEKIRKTKLKNGKSFEE